MVMLTDKEIDMRKYVTALVAATLITTPALAQRGHWDHHGGHGGGGNWIVPALIGGAVVGAIMAQPSQPRVDPTPIVVAPPPPVYVYPQEYRPMYKFVDVYIPECNCYKSIKVQIN